MTDLDAGASGLATVASEARIDLLDVERAAVMIRQCKDVDTVREIRDQARAIETYQRQRKASLEAQNDAAEIALRAERRLGEILREEGGNPQLSKTSTVRLDDIGITRDDSSRFQKLAKIPEPVFDQHIASVRARCEKLTTSGTIAAVSLVDGYDSNEWYTPSRYIEAARQVMGGIDLDPASNELAQRTVKATRYFTQEHDGLVQPWEGRVWCNPPYSQPLASNFGAKLIAEWEAGRVTESVMVQNASTDTSWFHELAQRASLLCLTKGRINFSREDGGSAANRYGQVFFYFGPDRDRFAEVFGEFGLVMRPQRRAARGFAE